MTRNLAKEGMVLFLLLLLLPCAQGGAAVAATATKLASSPNLLLITLDTTLADHLGCYGDKKASTPVLDRLASEGALFVEAHSHVPLTLPSHSVMMTGDLPSTLNLRVNGLKLGSKHATLASVLTRRGYWTGAEAVKEYWAALALSKALAMDPTRDEAAANLGKVAFQQGKTDEAILAYKRAARIAPCKAGYLATLGSLYLNSKDDPITALSYFRKALNSNFYGSGAGDLRALIQNIEHQLASKDGATDR